MKKKILLFVLSMVCLAALLGVVFVANADETPETIIAGHNLSLDDSVQIIYYVKQSAPEGAEVGVLCWFDPQESYTLENAQYKLAQNGTRTISGTEYAQYFFPYVAAKMYTQDVYAVSYVKVGDIVTYSKPDKYSVLQYCQNKKNSGSALGKLIDQILEYGAAAQIYFNFNVDRLANADYYQISVKGGVLEDGTTEGLFVSGSSAVLTASMTAEKGYGIIWKNSADEIVGEGSELSVLAEGNESYTASVIALEHTYGEWIVDKEATCTAAGSRHKTCTDCGDTITEEIPATGHSFGEWQAVTAQSCTSGGIEVRTCANCGAREQRTYPAPGHQFGDWVTVKPATCEKGLEERTCAVCGNVEKKVLPADYTLHIWGEDACTVCGEHKASEGLQYELLNNGNIAICGYTGSDTTIYLPSSFYGSVVTTIKAEAFKNQKQITEIVIPESITSVDSTAFSGCTNIQRATMPTQAISAIPKNRLQIVILNSGTDIDWCAFYGCTSLKSVAIPDSVTRIGDSAFSGCTSLTSAFIGNGMTNIGYAAFYDCASLVSIAIPDSVTNIGSHAFQGCTSLTSVTIGNSVTSIGEYAFFNCTSLMSFTVAEENKTYCSVDGILYNESKTQIIHAPAAIHGDVVILDSVASIGEYAFWGCTFLTSITIPDSVVSIEEFAFQNCTSLMSTTIGNSMASIGEYAFYGCTSLSEIVFLGTEEEWNAISKGILWDDSTGSYTVIICNKGLEFESNEDGTCYVAGIGTCTDTDIVIPPVSPDGDKVIGLGEGAFEFLDSLTSLQIPNGVTVIEDGACYGCSNLTLVTIPGSVTKIGYLAFSDCSSLSEIVFQGAEEEWAAVTKQGYWDDSTGDYTLQFAPLLRLSYYTKQLAEPLSLAEALADLKVYYLDEQLIAADFEISSPTFSASQNGVYTVFVSYSVGGETYTARLFLTVALPRVSEKVSYPILEEVALEKTEAMPGLPSVGDVEILVIPIAFTNSDYGTDDEIKARLEIAFNGSAEETGWRSLSGYYREVSYGALNLHANILDVYQTGVDYDLTTGDYAEEDYAYLAAAIAYYDDVIDYSLYDQNGDGTIDCVYLVYLAPYDGNTNLWWAYCYEYVSDDVQFYDDCLLDYYLWMSIEFFDEPMAWKYDPQSDDAVPSIVVNCNCETVIHETGHALGLDDYYDYNTGRGNTGGVGGFAMMDENQGDHDPYSKAILGWINPTVVANADYDCTLRSFAETGDAVIISKKDGGSYFEEYYIIALYTPTGVNIPKKDAGQGMPSQTGVMVWHIDATLRADSYYMMHDVSAYNITLYNNGSAAHKLIDLVCADGSTDIDTDSYYHVSDKDLFAAESVISGLTWYDGTAAGFTITLGTFETDAETGVQQVFASIAF